MKWKDNGKPITVGLDYNGQATSVPSFLTSPDQLLDRIPAQKNDTRLETTFAPASSQALLQKVRFYYIKKEPGRFMLAALMLFSPPAVERLSSGLFQEVIITNTIPVSEQNYFPQLTILSVANLIGETIWRVHDDCVDGFEPYSGLDIDGRIPDLSCMTPRL